MVPVFGFRVSNFRFGSQISGFRSQISVFGSRISGVGSRISGFGSQISGFGSRISGFRSLILGFRGCTVRQGGGCELFAEDGIRAVLVQYPVQVLFVRPLLTQDLRVWKFCVF